MVAKIRWASLAVNPAPRRFRENFPIRFAGWKRDSGPPPPWWVCASCSGAAGSRPPPRGPLRSERRGAMVEGDGTRTARPEPAAAPPPERSTMSPRIGFDAYTISHRDLSAEATLEFARAHGFDGVQVL